MGSVNYNMKSQLLCSFTTKENLELTIREIQNSYVIIFEKIYVLQNEDNVEELLCTYNADNTQGIDYNSVENTISLHRKKHSNTLYTINALNEVIREKNGGVLDKSYMVDWDEFENTLLLTNESGLTKIPTKIHQIIDVTTWKN